jgi:hypothetical protein
MAEQKVFGTLKPTGDFWVAHSKNIEAEGEALENFIPIILTQEEYNTIYEKKESIVITLADGTQKEITYDKNRIYFIKMFPPVDPNPILD